MKIRALERHHNYEELLEYDELSKAMAYGEQCICTCPIPVTSSSFLVVTEGEVLGNYSEGRIKFRPTYKYKPGTCDFEEEKKRVPSYTVSSTSALLCDDVTGCLTNNIEFVFRTECCFAASVKETLFAYITTVYRKSLRPTTSLCSASMKSHSDPEEIR